MSTQSRSFQTQIDTTKKISRGPTVFKITTHRTEINESSFSRHNSILYKETALKTRKNKSPDLQTKVDNLHRALEIKIFILSL